MTGSSRIPFANADAVLSNYPRCSIPDDMRGHTKCGAEGTGKRYAGKADRFIRLDSPVMTGQCACSLSGKNGHLDEREEQAVIMPISIDQMPMKYSGQRYQSAARHRAGTAKHNLSPSRAPNRQVKAQRKTSQSQINTKMNR